MGAIHALAATGLAGGLVVTAVAPAQATTLPEDGVLQQRLERFCERVPNLIERAEKLQPRLSGDADTRGSLAWLRGRVEDAEAAGFQRQSRRLADRLQRREELVAKLPERIENLRQAHGECKTAGLGESS